MIDDGEEVLEPDEELNHQRNRKLLTRNWLVQDTDSAPDKNNCDQIHYIYGNGYWGTLTGYLSPKTDKKQKRWPGPVHYQVKQADREDVMLLLNKYHVRRVLLKCHFWRRLLWPLFQRWHVRIDYLKYQQEDW